MNAFLKWLTVICLSIFVLTGCGGGKSKEQKLKEEQQEDYIKSLPKTKAIDVLWDRDLGDFNTLGFEFVIDNGISYSINADGKLTAVNLENGKVQWSEKTRNEISAGVGIGPNALYAVDYKARLVAFDRENGEQLWRSEVRSEVLIPPVFAGGNVIVKTLDARLIAFDANSGEQIWTYRHTKPGLSLRGGSTPVVERNFLFTGFEDGRLIAVDAISGNLLWDVPVGKSSGRNEIARLTDIDARPIIDGNELFVSAFQRRTMALDIGAGNVIWTRPFSSFQNFAVDKQALYMIEAKNSIIALNRESGNVIWAIEDLSEVTFTSISVIGSKLLLTDNDGLALILNRSDGEILGKQKFSGGIPLNQPIVIDDIAYVLTANGDLKALTIN